MTTSGHPLSLDFHSAHTTGTHQLRCMQLRATQGNSHNPRSARNKQTKAVDTLRCPLRMYTGFHAPTHLNVALHIALQKVYS